MTRFANRYAIPRTARMARRAAMIPEEQVFSRTIAAIKTIKAMPDRERRFLMAGTKSGWVQTLVEFSDLVAQAEQPADDYEPRESFRPSRAEMSDAMIAGEWFAKLALLHWNIAEYEAALDRYRAGRGRAAWVRDQTFLNLYAMGFSLKFIGGRFGLNEHQAERRLSEIRRSLYEIANGTARLGNIDERRLERKRYKARAFGG